jgi:hypothetical protein
MVVGVIAGRRTPTRGSWAGAFSEVDRRTHPGWITRDLTAELVQHIGGEPVRVKRIVNYKTKLTRHRTL